MGPGSPGRLCLSLVCHNFGHFTSERMIEIRYFCDDCSFLRTSTIPRNVEHGSKLLGETRQAKTASRTLPPPGDPCT